MWSWLCASFSNKVSNVNYVSFLTFVALDISAVSGIVVNF